MNVIRVIYENGVFRPLDPVSLPEGSEVWLEPRSAATASADIAPELALMDLEPDGEEPAAIMGRSYPTGCPDLSERHNEHQP